VPPKTSRPNPPFLDAKSLRTHFNIVSRTKFEVDVKVITPQVVNEDLSPLQCELGLFL
jgi:hypothetical protein